MVAEMEQSHNNCIHMVNSVRGYDAVDLIKSPIQTDHVKHCASSQLLEGKLSAAASPEDFGSIKTRGSSCMQVRESET